MRRLGKVLIAGAVAAAVVPGVAVAQCEGGVTAGGYYLSTGAYVSGGCSYTNPTTTGQLYPSGAQVVPSTNPAAGVTRLPGQRVPSGLQPTIADSVNGSYGPIGPFGSSGAYTTSAGPGARVLPSTTGTGLFPNTAGAYGATFNTLADQANPLGLRVTEPFVVPANTPWVDAVPSPSAALPETFDPLPAQANISGFAAGTTVGLPTETAVGTIGLPGTFAPNGSTVLPGALGAVGSRLGAGSALTNAGARVVAPGTADNVTTTGSLGGVRGATADVGVLGAVGGASALGAVAAPGAVSTTGGVGALSVLPGVTPSNPAPAYGVSLPPAAVPAAASTAPEGVVPNTVRYPLPLPPGRGGATYAGEELEPSFRNR